MRYESLLADLEARYGHLFEASKPKKISSKPKMASKPNKPEDKSTQSIAQLIHRFNQEVSLISGYFPSLFKQLNNIVGAAEKASESEKAVGRIRRKSAQLEGAARGSFSIAETIRLIRGVLRPYLHKGLPEDLEDLEEPLHTDFKGEWIVDTPADLVDDVYENRTLATGDVPGLGLQAKRKLSPEEIVDRTKNIPKEDTELLKRIAKRLATRLAAKERKERKKQAVTSAVALSHEHKKTGRAFTLLPVPLSFLEGVVGEKGDIPRLINSLEGLKDVAEHVRQNWSTAIKADIARLDKNILEKDSDVEAKKANLARTIAVFASSVDSNYDKLDFISLRISVVNKAIASKKDSGADKLKMAATIKKLLDEKDDIEADLKLKESAVRSALEDYKNAANSLLYLKEQKYRVAKQQENLALEGVSKNIVSPDVVQDLIDGLEWARNELDPSHFNVVTFDSDDPSTWPEPDEFKIIEKAERFRDTLVEPEDLWLFYHIGRLGIPTGAKKGEEDPDEPTAKTSKVLDLTISDLRKILTRVSSRFRKNLKQILLAINSPATPEIDVAGEEASEIRGLSSTSGEELADARKEMTAFRDEIEKITMKIDNKSSTAKQLISGIDKEYGIFRKGHSMRIEQREDGDDAEILLEAFNAFRHIVNFYNNNLTEESPAKVLSAEDADKLESDTYDVVSRSFARALSALRDILKTDSSKKLIKYLSGPVSRGYDLIDNIREITGLLATLSDKFDKSSREYKLIRTHITALKSLEPMYIEAIDKQQSARKAVEAIKMQKEDFDAVASAKSGPSDLAVSIMNLRDYIAGSIDNGGDSRFLEFSNVLSNRLKLVADRLNEGDFGAAIPLIRSLHNAMRQASIASTIGPLERESIIRWLNEYDSNILYRLDRAAESMK